LKAPERFCSNYAIIVTGSIVSRPDGLEQLLALCLEHVRRSRLEPGCRSHAVHVDVENPLRLFFFEEWEDREYVRRSQTEPGFTWTRRIRRGCSSSRTGSRKPISLKADRRIR
jgi:quinol monooxygenase YgiN